LIDLNGTKRLDDIGHIEATRPDAGYAALDVFMCGAANPDACVPVLREAFGQRVSA
jgi:S-adenosylmethionine/arginine decarboxylase-like enzyme